MKATHYYRFALFLIFTVLLNENPYIQAQTQKKETSERFTLPPLPYKANALSPIISEETMNLHHGKHLKGYITNLNKLIIGTPFENSDLETIVKNSNGAIFNNAAQTLNHIIYFNTFSPHATLYPSGALLIAIEKEWGSFDNFKKAFSTAATSLFGSGWVWLAKDKNGKLFILQENNAGNPITKGYTPLLGIDVWEHAYYLDYQNKRADHIEKIWTIIDWNTVKSRYDK